MPAAMSARLRLSDSHHSSASSRTLRVSALGTITTPSLSPKT